MSLRRTQPRKFEPSGVSDAIDEFGAFPGACVALSNLIPSARQKYLWVARPAATLLTNFSSFTSPGKISCLIIIGDIAYGMLATGRNAGFDEPFAFDLVAQAFIPVTGVVAGNVPTSPPTSGTWVPPTAALVASRLIVTHPGFQGTANKFGWFDLSTPSTPVWNAGNTTGTPLPVVPNAVAQYSDRAWFSVNLTGGSGSYASLYFTDTGTLNLTTATQILTFGDNIPITALAGLPYQNIFGGIVQALMVFKGALNGVYNIYQVTGDVSNTQSVQTGTTAFTTQLVQVALSENALNVSTSTLAPNSIASGSDGLFFVAPDGLRKIDWQAHISEPIGADGQGINAPFFTIPTPSRIAAAATATCYRVSFANANVLGAPVQEFWYDITRKLWSGPHTFPFDIIRSWGNSFVGAPNGVLGLWKSDFEVQPTSTYTENGVQMRFALQTTQFQNPGDMAECAQVETQVYASMTDKTYFNLSAINENGAIIDSVSYTAAGTGSAIWGSFVWGSTTWGTAVSPYRARRIDWHAPIVYNRVSFLVAGMADQNLALGCIYMREEHLGYQQQIA